MPDDHADRDIRELLESAAPHGPDLGPHERAAAVTGRARAVTRRHRIALAGATVAVLLAAVAIPVLGQDDDDRGSSLVTERSDAPVKEVACPTSAIEMFKAPRSVDLPAGATSVRACPATAGGDPQSADDSLDGLPTTALSAGADDFVAAVRALPDYEVEEKCALLSPAVHPWALVVGYPDGSTATLGSTYRLCSPVSVDGGDKGVEQILGLFTTAVADQTASAAPSCPPADGVGFRPLVADPDTYDGRFVDLDVVAGVVCYAVDPLGSRVYAEDTGVLTPAQLERIRFDIGSRATAEAVSEFGCIDSGPTRLVVLADAAGRRLSLTDVDCTGEFAWSDGFWKPSARTERILARTLGGAIPE